MASAPLGNRRPAIVTTGIFYNFLYCCFIFIANEISSGILVELTLDLCGILESSISSSYTSIIDWVVIRDVEWRGGGVKSSASVLKIM